MKRILKSAAVLALASAMALSASATLAITDLATVENSDVTVVKAGKVALTLPTETIVDAPAAAVAVDAALPADLSAAQTYLVAHDKLIALDAELVASENFKVAADAAAADALADAAAALLGDAAAIDPALIVDAAVAIDPALIAQAGAALEGVELPVADAAAAAADAFDLTTAKLTVDKDATATLTAKFDNKLNNLYLIVGQLDGSYEIAVKEAANTKVIKDPNAKVTIIKSVFGKATDTVNVTMKAKSNVAISDIIVATELSDNSYSAAGLAVMVRPFASGSVVLGGYINEDGNFVSYFDTDNTENNDFNNDKEAG